MSDPYRDDYGSFHPDAGWLPACAATLSQRLVGRSDWATIKAFYDDPAAGFVLRQPATFDPAQNPALLPLGVTTVAVAQPTADPRPVEAPIWLLTTRSGGQVLPGASARAFLFQQSRLIDLGRPSRDQVLARGARPGDRICVFARATQLQGCGPVGQAAGQVVLSQRSDWSPVVTITPVTSTTLRLDVTGVAAGLALRARLYPSSGDARPPVGLAPAVGGYSGALTSPAAAPAFEGFVHLWVEEADAPAEGRPRRELVVDYQVGGNPGRIWGRNAPRGNPGRIWGRNAPILSPDGAALLFFRSDLALQEGQLFALQTVASPPAPPAWARPVGRAYRVGANAQLSLADSSLILSYPGDEVDQRAEAGLAMYRWDGGAWARLQGRHDPVRNEVSAAAGQPGIYALMTSEQVALAGPGWNIMTYPVREPRPVGEALSSIAGAYNVVYSYDSTAPADPWRVFTPDPAIGWANDLAQLEPDRGYWIYLTRPATLFLRDAPAALQVAPDLATALEPPAAPALIYGVLRGTSASAAPGTPVEAYVGAARCGAGLVRSLPGGGAGYAIKVRAAGPAEPVCGRASAQITIRLGGQPHATATWDNTRASAAAQLAEGARLYLPLLRR
jgi:hypothetical protein